MPPVLKSCSLNTARPPRARRSFALLSWVMAFIISLLSAPLQPTAALAASAAVAAAPTFTSSCFTPAAIHNGLPPQQTSSYTVPATGVTTVRAVLRGQNGGRGGYSGGPYMYNGGTDGGLGSTLVVEVAVTPGQVLQVGRLTGAPGGSAVQAEFSGGKGGDAQYLSTAGADGCQHALAVAGGGGGGGGKGARGGNADAGAGATGGQNGGNNAQEDGGGGGGAQATIGGTPGARGYGGAFSFSECNDGNNGRWGEFLTGGDGANPPDSKQTSGGSTFPVNSGCAWSSFPGGGGGGGGYRYGGGGGSPFGRATGIWDTSNAGGGGGGSSYIDPSATKLSLSAGASAGDPLVVPVYETATTITSSPNPSIYGNPVTITARVTSLGTGQPVAGGTVNIYVEGTFTAVPVGANGQALLTTTTLPTGNNRLQAQFLDTTNATEADRSSWTSSFITQVVNAAVACAPAPVFRDQLLNTAATYGTDAYFSASVSTAPVAGGIPTVQWQTSTDGGTTWVNANTPGDVFIETTSTPNTAHAYMGFNISLPPGDQKYRAIATTCGGVATSNAATLNVKGIAFSLTSLPAKTYGNAAFDTSSYAVTSTVVVRFSSATPPICTVAGNMVTLLAAGTCTIAADQDGTTGYPTAPQVQQSFTVNKKTLTVRAGSPPSQPQGSPTLPEVTCTSTGFVGTDTFATAPLGRIGLIDPTGNFRPRTKPETLTAGNYVTQCSGGDPGRNYVIDDYTNGTFVVGPPAPPTLTITANDKSYTYGTTPPALDATYSSGSITRSGTLSCSVYAKSDTGYTSPLTLTNTTPVVTGGYAIRCSGITSANPIAWANGTLTVNPASVAVTAGSPTTQTYGTTAAPSVICSATGFVGAEGFSTNPTGAVYDSTGTTEVAIASTSDAGNYVTKCTGGSPGGNYTISGYTPGSFTINPAALTVTPDAGQSMPYGSTAVPVLSFNLAGFKHGQQSSVLTHQPSCATAATSYNGTTPGSGSPVGTYGITCSGGQADNYTFSDNSGARQFAVTPAGLTITPDTMVTSGGTPPTLTWQASGLANGDTAEGAFAAPNTAPACATTATTNRLGAYPITCSGAANPNYSIDYVSGTLNVTADGASQLAIVAGSPQSAVVTSAYGTPFKVVVRDQYGNPVVDGTVVTFTAPASGASGTFAGGGATATTTNGVATAPTFTANGVAGAFIVQATAGGGVVPLSLTNTPGPVARFAVVANPATPTVGASVGLTVTAQDNQGNPVPSYTGTVHFTATDAQATLPADYTFVAGDGGTHIFAATLATAGNQTITVTDTVNMGVTGSATVAVGAAAPSTLAATGGTPQSRAIGQGFDPLTAIVRDAYGNPVAGVAVTFAAPASGASATFPGGAASATVVTGADGAATAPATTANSTAGSYTVVASGAGGSANFALTNTPGPATRLALATDQTGTVQSGTPVMVTVTALDAGGNLSTAYAGTLHFTSGDAQSTFPANYTFTVGDAGTHQFAVTLRTGGAQTITATDTVNGALTASTTLQVVVPATPAQVSVAPASLSFGVRQVGTVSDSQQVTVTNTGGSALNMATVTFGGANADQFNLAYNTCVGAIPAGAACTIGVRFAPTAVHFSSASLQIANDAAGSPQTVTLSGTGNATPQPAPAAATVSPAGLTYGTTLVGLQTNAQQITVTNTGGTSLNITGVTIVGANPDDFVITYNNCAGAIVPSAACTIGVAFAPTAADLRSASLQVTDDAVGSPQTVALAGTGSAAPQPSPAAASVSPSSLSFPDSQVGQRSNAQQVTVANTGGSPLNLSGVTLAGANADQFALEYNTCVGNVQAGSSCVIGVRFVPSIAQASSATLQIADNASGSPQTVALTGTGTAIPQPAAPQANLGPSALTFAATEVGQQTDFQQVTLGNTGGSPLAVSGVTLGGANPGDFNLAFNSCSGNVQPGSTCVIGVRFKPTASGARSASLLVADRAAGSPHSVALTGSGTSQPAPPAPQSTVKASVSGGGTVTPAGATSYTTGSTATYAATPAAGQVFVGWTLDGSYVGYANPLTITVGGNRTLLAAFVARTSFSDVPTSDPDYQAITTLAALGVINPAGVNGSGQIQLDRPVARAEAAAFIARIFGWAGEFHANPFPDRCDAAGNCVDDELWNAVAALADYGVVGGYTDAATCQSAGTSAPCYLPRDNVSRVQVVSIVARAFTKIPDLRPTGYWERQAAVPGQYANVQDAGTQRSDLATYRANAGAIPGQANDGTFPDPDGPASRRFVIQVLYAAFNAQFGGDRVP